MSLKLDQSSHLAIGIDLGTTYSTVAYIDESGKPVSIPNSSGELLTPSSICFDGNAIVVGKDAVKASAFLADYYFECFKREMGEDTTYSVNGIEAPAEVLSAILLEKLKVDAEKQVGVIRNVVITVPAYFDENRRQSTMVSAKLAGIDAIEIINEPTSAAIAYGATTSGDSKTVLVYDLGGGTFDVTILKIQDGEFTAVATDGDVRLGGKDFDERLVEFAAKEFDEEHGVDPRESSTDLAQLWLDAEEIKQGLSERESVPLVMHFSGLRHRVNVTREKFESLTKDLLRRTQSTVELLLRDAQLSWDDIDELLAVGGSSRMPAVREMLATVSGKSPNFSMNPDLVVGHGAALLCHSLINRTSEKSLSLVDVNSHSLGIIGIEKGTKRKTNRIVIPRNTPLPFSITKTFATARDGQKSVSIVIVEGESRRPEECSEIGKCSVRNLPPGLPRNTKVRVHFAYDSGGKLAVSAQIPATRQSAATVIERKTIADLGDLDSWKSKLSGATVQDTFSESDQLRALDNLCSRIARSVSGKTCQQFPQVSERIQSLTIERAELKTKQTKLQDLQASSANRSEMIELSGKLAKIAANISSLTSELKFAEIDLGRQIVMSNSESEEDSSLAEEARKIINSLQ